ncbi:MAG: ATPase domain-containing protein, partial [Pseudomonadota bacterium]
IRTGGVEVYPRLVAAEHRKPFSREKRSSGIKALDSLLGGGVECGTSTLVLGPAGTGKSLLLLQFVTAALKKGERAMICAFDEEVGLTFARAKSMGIDLQKYVDQGLLFIEQIDAAELSPGEFSHRLRKMVMDNDVKVVVVDSLNGYQAAMPQENALIL